MPSLSFNRLALGSEVRFGAIVRTALPGSGSDQHPAQIVHCDQKRAFQRIKIFLRRIGLQPMGGLAELVAQFKRTSAVVLKALGLPLRHPLIDFARLCFVRLL